MARPSVYTRPLINTRLLSFRSRLINPIADILVASGQGLIAVIRPNTMAVIKEYSVFSNMLCKISIFFILKSISQHSSNSLLNCSFQLFRFAFGIHKRLFGKVNPLIALQNQ